MPLARGNDMTATEVRMRRFLRFRLSTLLLAVVCCGVALAWWKDRQDMGRDRQAWERERHDAALLREAARLGRRADGDFRLKEADYRFIRASLQRAEPFAELVADAEQPGRRAAVWQELLARLSDPAPATRLRAAVTAVKLTPIPAEAAPRLIDLLEDEDDEVRAQAVYLIRFLDERSQAAAVSKVRDMLDYPQAETRLAAFLSVVYHAPADEGLPALLAAFEREPDDGTRRLMAAALCRLEERRGEAP